MNPATRPAVGYRSRPALALVIIAAVASGALGCERGDPYECTCSVLTDYDDATKHVVEICAPTDARAANIGKGCAQSGAPAKVDACACKRVEGPRCDLGRCVMKPR